MKTIEQVREEYKECSQGHKNKNFCFTGETVYCKECDAHYDLGMKKWS